jgi:hypothetical protein
MKERDEIEIVEQAVFGDDGDIKTDGGSVQTGFDEWGVVTHEPERETKIDRPEAEFPTADDRERTDEDTDQETLVFDVDDGQQTLGGESAEGKSKW